jgi:hypothetical protein
MGIEDRLGRRDASGLPEQQQQREDRLRPPRPQVSVGMLGRNAASRGSSIVARPDAARRTLRRSSCDSCFVSRPTSRSVK